MALANVVILSSIVVHCSAPTWELVERRLPTFRLKHLVLSNKIGCDKGKKCRAAVIYASATDTTSIDSTSAKDAVNLGLSLFNQGRIKDAITQFEKALTLDPNPDEAKAALYNKACCHASREEGKKTAEALRKALRDYNLNFSVILNDPDMAAFRAMPEFRELQNEARLGGDDIGGSFRRDLKLISEVQAPFRAVRKFFYAALCVAAGISTFFTIPRLSRVIQGGDGAPEFWETLGNTAINIGGIIILVALFKWENRKEEEQIAQISRDETLSRLPLRLSSNRVIELVQLRDTARPVILAGTKDAVNKAVQRAEKFRTELIERGILIVPLVWRSEGENPIRKKGFGGRQKLAIASSSSAGEFGKRAKDIVTKTIVEVEKRFKAEIVSPSAWESWIREQQESEGVTPGEDVYIILRLDGRIRKSGRLDLSYATILVGGKEIRIEREPQSYYLVEDYILDLEVNFCQSDMDNFQGMPNWEEIIKELPPLDSFISKLEK